MLWTLYIAAAVASAPAQALDPCAPAEDGWISARLQADKRFAGLLAAAEAHRFQIVITEVIRDKAVTLTTHSYRAGVEYYYPASAIKTFASVAALRELALLKMDRETPVAICKGSAKKCTTTRDRSNQPGEKITLGHEIRKMQIVSDNGAFNRLYDFVGHAAMNTSLVPLGFPSLRFGHRLSTRETAEQHRHTPAMELRPARGKGDVVRIPERTSEYVPASHGVPNTLVGSGVKVDGKIVEGPKEFEGRNGVLLCDMQRLTIALVMPERGPDLGLSAADREFLVGTMTIDPKASQNPVFRDPAETEDRFKPMLPGMLKVLPRSRIRYINKAGKAFGFHVENAYIEDTASGRAYFVAATVYANKDGILDDDRYDYADVTEPFYAHLGELLARTWAP